MNWKEAILASCLLTLSALPCQARDYAGTVRALKSKQYIKLKLQDGSEKSFKLGADTEIRIHGRRGTCDELTVGDDVVVRSSNNKMADAVKRDAEVATAREAPHAAAAAK